MPQCTADNCLTKPGYTKLGLQPWVWTCWDDFAFYKVRAYALSVQGAQHCCSTPVGAHFMSGDLTASERLLLTQFEALDEIKVSAGRAAA